jgi:hypothetical protein
VSPAIRACRSCGAGELALVLSLGAMPLANALLTAADLGRPEPRYPLDLVVCAWPTRYSRNRPNTGAGAADSSCRFPP